ncbi:hypothetical protein BY458DRAFT_506499 [Sporodiniella umbellata]|nr:hypothetical protein BY458DRAFT_506499 [Sporodiniella umbellata]
MSRRFLFYFIRPIVSRNVIFPKMHYTTKRRLEASMGGIFEPFLDTKIDKTQQEPISPKELLLNKSVKDLLPDQKQLELLIQHKQTSLSLEKQKEIANIVLDHIINDKPIDRTNLLKLVDNKPTELTAFANVILRMSKYGAPISLELYRISMEQGDDNGAFSYASMVHRGYRGTPKKEEEGIKILSQLSQKGHPYAQMNLAAIIMRTQPSRVDAAIQLYELAAPTVSSAYSELGRMYRLGYGVHQDHIKALDYFKQGAQKGNPQCQFMLGVYYSSNLVGEPDQAKAFKCFQKAAIKGLPEAQYNVGLRFLKGIGTESNPFNAAEFFRMAAMQGFQLAQMNLAGMYYEGITVKKDMDEARVWLEKAAASGGNIGKDAQKRLGALDKLQGKKKDKCSIM